MVFCFILLSIEVFAFFPLTRPLVRQRSLGLHLGITLLLVAITTAVLLTRGRSEHTPKKYNRPTCDL